MAQWNEHYTDLFDNPSAVDESVINGLPQKGIIAGKMTDPTINEIKFTIKEVNTGKAPGLDGIPVELLHFGGDNVVIKILALIIAVWNGDPTPQDWVDAIVLSLYKGKCSKSNCGDHRGISFLGAVGKDLVELTDKVDLPWCHTVIQWGFSA